MVLKLSLVTSRPTRNRNVDPFFGLPLPAWIKASRHRLQLLRAIGYLRTQLEKTTPSERAATAFTWDDASLPPVNDSNFRPPY